jgi:SAM-dependent methyltransferase
VSRNLARDLHPGWRDVGALESVEQRTARWLSARSRRLELERARATLLPLAPWDLIPDSSYATYTGPANHVRIRRILDFVLDGDRILDLGIGFGYVTGILLRERHLAHYCGTDLRPRFLDATRAMLVANALDERPCELHVLDLYQLTADFLGRVAPDLVLLLEVLEHVEDPVGALRTIAQATPQDTLILATVPLLGRLEGVWGHRSVFGRERVAEIWLEAGLTIHRIEPVYNVWALVLASRTEAPPERLTGAPRHPRLLGPLARLLARRGRAPRHHTFTDIAMNGPEAAYRRPAEEAEVDLVPRRVGLRCTVTAQAPNGLTGGVSLATKEPSIVRLQLSLLNPEQIDAVTVAGYDRAGLEKLRWEWSGTLSGDRLTHVLKSGASGRRFDGRPEDDPTDVERVELTLRVRKGCTAGFMLHRAAFLRATR